MNFLTMEPSGKLDWAQELFVYCHDFKDEKEQRIVGYNTEEFHALMGLAGLRPTYETNQAHILHHASEWLNKIGEHYNVPDISIVSGDFKDTRGAFIFPHNIILLNCWHMVTYPNETLQTLKHELTHAVITSSHQGLAMVERHGDKNLLGHGRVFYEMYCSLWGGAEVTDQVLPYHTLVSNTLQTIESTLKRTYLS